MLGMSQFLARFCPSYSDVTAVLRELLPKNVEFCWKDDIHGVAWRKLIKLLTSAPVLGYYDVTKPATIQADASLLGYGAAILQDGKVIEYASRSLTRTERDTFSNIERELMGVVFALERFHQYVYAKSDVTVETDHKPLINIRRKSLMNAPKRLQRLLLRLQPYDVSMVYKPGSQMFIGDTLSRAPIDDAKTSENLVDEDIAALRDIDNQMADLRLVASERTIEEINAAAAADEQYQMLKRQIAVGWPSSAEDVPRNLREYVTFSDELATCNDLVFKGTRIVIPRGYRQTILDRIHSSHAGINGCIRRAREAVFYPGLTSDIKRTVGACAICQSLRSDFQKETLLPHEAPSRPFEKIGVDIFTFKDKPYLVTVCYLSGFFEIDRLQTKKISEIIQCLKRHMARHGIPNELMSDNSPFNAAEFKAFAENYGFKCVTSSPRYSQSNGKVENCVKVAKRILTRASESGYDPFLALLDWRNTPSEAGNLSPAQIMFNRRTRTILPMTEQLLKAPRANEAHSALSKSKPKQAKYYNIGAKDRLPLNIGQTVRVKLDDRSDWQKGRIVNIRPFRSYDVQLESGVVRRRTSHHIRRTDEPPTIIDDDDSMDTAVTGSPEIPTIASPSESPSSSSAQANTRVDIAPARITTNVTRSGRAVIKPARYRDN